MASISWRRAAAGVVALGLLGLQPLQSDAMRSPDSAEGKSMHGQSTDDANRQERLWVDSRRADCVGVGPRKCLRVKRSPEGDWQLFYESIAGFDYQEGYTYELLVHVRERPNPPADASSLVYELVEVRSKAAAGSSEDSAELTGHAWQLASFPEGQGVVAEGNEATMEFDGETGQVAGSAGCNRYAGGYEASGDSLSFGLLHMTMMACPDDDRTRQETVFVAALESVASYRIENGELLLFDEAGETLMTLAPRPDVALVGTEWRATGINNGLQAVVSVDQNAVPTAVFADGRVSGSAGCNQFHASYTSGDGTLEIGPAAATRKMCPSEVMDQESWFLSALETVATFSIDRDKLELRTAEGALAVSFRAVVPE